MNISSIFSNILASLLAVLIGFGSLPNPPSQQSMLRDPATIIRTGEYPGAVAKFKNFRESVEDYSFFEKYCFKPHQNEKDMGTYVIPGLKISESLNRDGQPSACGNMIPQGICASKKYLIVSCYCHDKTHHSVLQIIDKETGKFVKTVVLPDYPHAGSVAYDPANNMVWISTGSTNKASLSSISLDKIKSYSFPKSQEAIKYAKRWQLPGLIRNSYMTYYNSTLYAGTFTTGAQSSPLDSFFVDNKGLVKMNGKKVSSIQTSTLNEHTQGIAMNDDYIFVCRSNGPYETSSLSVFKMGTSQLFDINAIKVFTLPECLEQCWIDGDKLYIMFESAGWPFRNDTIHHIDRIISVDIKSLKLDKKK